MAASEELTCAQFVELVSDYVEGALKPADRQRFDDHLADCGGCSTYLEQLRATITLTGRLRTSDVPAEAVDALLSAFRNYNRSA
jgi:anti-sigma factor RsiW